MIHILYYHIGRVAQGNGHQTISSSSTTVIQYCATQAILQHNALLPHLTISRLTISVNIDHTVCSMQSDSHSPTDHEAKGKLVCFCQKGVGFGEGAVSLGISISCFSCSTTSKDETFLSGFVSTVQIWFSLGITTSCFPYSTTSMAETIFVMIIWLGSTNVTFTRDHHFLFSLFHHINGWNIFVMIIWLDGTNVTFTRDHHFLFSLFHNINGWNIFVMIIWLDSTNVTFTRDHHFLFSLFHHINGWNIFVMIIWLDSTNVTFTRDHHFLFSLFHHIKTFLSPKTESGV